MARKSTSSPSGTGLEEILPTARKTAAKKAPAKKAAAKTPAKKTTVPRGAKTVVKMIQTVDSAPGHDTTVYFSDGSRAVVQKDSSLNDMLTKPESVAPHLIQVTISGKNIVAATPIVLDAEAGSE